MERRSASVRPGARVVATAPSPPPSYAPDLRTVHDQAEFSVLEMHRKTREGARQHRFTVLWGRDRDKRVITVIEQIRKLGVAHAFIAYGEDEGNFTAIMAPWVAAKPPETIYKLGGYVMKALRSALEEDIWDWAFGSPAQFDCPDHVPYGRPFYRGYVGPFGMLSGRKDELLGIIDRFDLK
jgi:hypothetical protein